MPKYRVHVCRIAYSHLDIEVDAPNPETAEQKAEEEAGNYLFPNENHSEYESQGALEITNG